MQSLSSDDAAFLERFETCSIEKTCWSHEAHVRMAWLQMRRSSSFDEALNRIRTGIQKLNASLGSQGYHDTVTIAFARMIHFRMLHAPDSGFPEFLAANVDLLAKAPPFLSRFYSAERLGSKEAGDGFVSPDRRPLPPMGIVRPAADADAEDLARIYAPYVQHTPISFEAVAPDAQEMHKRMHESLAWLVYESEGRVVGYAYATRHRAREAYRWTVETSAYVDEKFHRVGLGRLLYARLFSLLTQKNFFLALAGITLPNENSVRLHESMGFTPVGVYHNIGYKLGRWHDVGWWQRPLQPAGATPSQ